MAKKAIFLGEDVYNGWNEKSYLSLIAETEKRLYNIPYQPEAPIDYLNTLYQLVCLYRKTFQYTKLKEIYSRIENLSPINNKYVEEIEVLRALTELRIHSMESRVDKEEEILTKCTKYAITHNRYYLLCDLTTKWGNYFSSLGHDDLSYLFHGISLDLTYQFRNKIKGRHYKDQLFYPISNFVYKINDLEEQRRLEEALFTSDEIDLSTREYLGSCYQLDCWANKNDFDTALYNDIYLQLYGDMNCKSVNNTLIEKYYSEDETAIDDYYNNHKSEFFPNDLVFYAMLSSIDDRERADILMQNIDKHVFIKNAPYIHQYMYLLEKEEKERMCIYFLNYIRNANHLIRYQGLEGYINFIKENDSIFDTQSIKEILLKKSGSNGIYDRVLSLLNLLTTKFKLSKGTKWVKRAIRSADIKDKELEKSIVDSIVKILDENCSFSKSYDAFEDNLKLCSNLSDGKDTDANENQIKDNSLKETMFHLIEEYKKTPSQLIFDLFSYSSDNSIPESCILTDEDVRGIRQRIESEIPNYGVLINLLKDQGWDINERDININFLYAQKNNLSYILYLFYNKEDAWLADEEEFNGDDPLWFSEKSHLVSPVFRLHQQQSFNKSSSLVLVLFPPTYIINADEMKTGMEDNHEHKWRDVVVVKSQYLISFLEKSGEFPKNTEFDNIGYSTSDNIFATTSQERVANEVAINQVSSQTKEGIIGKKEVEQDKLNDPWNLKQVYEVYKNSPYHFDKSYNNESFYENERTTEEKKSYDLQKVGLLKVLSAFLNLLADDNDTHMLSKHIEEATLGLYFKKTSVKFKLTIGWDYENRETLLKHFVIEDFNDDRMGFISRIGIGKGYLDGNDLYFRGNVVSEMCEVMVKIRNTYDDYSYFKQDKNKEEDSLQHIESIFRNSLIRTTFLKEGEAPNYYHNYFKEDWEKGISLVSAPILSDAVRRLAEKTAKTAIMSRNMSHNLGSHVMAYLKRDLASVGDIIQKGVLRDFYPLPESFGSQDGELYKVEELIKYIEKYTKEVEMPFLVGLGKFISYLQERQDFIATISTFYIPYFSMVNFKDDIYDTINPDYRYIRHSDRRGNRPENILMKYIAQSEGLSRNGKQVGRRTNDIIICFRNFNGINDYLNQKQRGKVIPNGPGQKDLTDMRNYSFYLPGGIVGRQALFTILENLIRNSAKHGFWRKKRNLVFTFDIFKGRELATVPESKELYNFLCSEPEWGSLFQSTDNKLERFYIITLTDNLEIGDGDFNSLKDSIKEEYVGDDTGQMINKHKGIKEIRISAAWMRGIVDDLKVPVGEPPVITVRKVGRSLQYIFCVLAPKKVLMLVPENEKEKREKIRQSVSKWEGWYVSDYYNYKRSNDKSYDIIVVDNDKTAKELRPYSSDRIVITNSLFDEVCSESAIESKLLNALYRQLYHIENSDAQLLISDGKTNKSDSAHIQVVSSDAEVNEKKYLYGYRTHHQDSQEFADYMTGELSKTMLSVEGITGNNSTDRLIRNEKLDDIWYYKHLHALKTKVAIFDERLFSKITGLDDDNLLDENYLKIGSREAITHVQKRIWYFNVIYNEAKCCFEIFGYQDFKQDGDNYYSRISKIAEIQPTTLNLVELGDVPSIKVDIENDSYRNFAYYISIHQGLMDKIYDAFKFKVNESYSKEVRMDKDKLDNAMKIAMCSVSAKLYNAFHELNEDYSVNLKSSFNKSIYGTGFEEQRFRPGFFIHSGRSKPSEYDMPQKQPFIQYAAIENAVYDCKYSLVELLKSARYEPND